MKLLVFIVVQYLLIFFLKTDSSYGLDDDLFYNKPGLFKNLSKNLQDKVFICPDNCYCDTHHGVIDRIACSCLFNIPPFPSTVKELDIDGCYTTILDCSAFDKLIRLRKLILTSFLDIDSCANYFRDQKLSLLDFTLKENYFADMPVNFFGNLLNLQKLTLERNNLPSLKAGCFFGLTNLKTLIIEEYEMFNVSDDAFQGLKQLVHFSFLIRDERTNENRLYKPAYRPTHHNGRGMVLSI